jgi:hypothetical protein
MTNHPTVPTTKTISLCKSSSEIVNLINRYNGSKEDIFILNTGPCVVFKTNKVTVKKRGIKKITRYNWPCVDFKHHSKFTCD